MVETKTPFFSLGSRGTVGNALTSQKSGPLSMLREKPVPSDPYSLAQAYQRWRYRDYAYRWQFLSEAQKQAYTTSGYRYHKTGYHMFLREQLTTLPDLAGEWRLDGVAGSVAIDSSKNLNHGTIYGALQAPGIVDNCLWFDGIDDYVRCGSDPSLDITTQITIEVRINQDPSVSSQQVVLISGDSYSQTYHLRIEADGKPHFGFNPDGPLRYLPTTTPITRGKWQHIACVFTSLTDMKVYLDGVDISGVRQDYTGYPKVFKRVDIGGIGTGVSFKGYIDWPLIYNRPLDTLEIPRHSKRRYPS